MTLDNTPAEITSLDAAFDATASEMFSRATEEAATPPAETGAGTGDETTAETPETAKEPAATGEGPARGADGKFLPKNSAGAEGAPSTAAASDEAPKDAAAQPEKDAPTAEPVPIPEHWSAERKAAFEAIPEAARPQAMAVYKQIEADHTRKSQELSTLQKQTQPFLQLAQKYAQSHRLAGRSTVEIFDRLANAEHWLRTGSDEQKRQVLLDTAKAYGITDLGQPVAAPDDEFADPQLKAIHEKNTRLEAEVAELRQRFQAIDATNATQQITSELDRAQSTVEQFRTAKGPDGNLSHPHYEALKEAIADLVGKGYDLEDAYHVAERKHPEVKKAADEARERARLKAEADKRAKQDAEEKRKAAEARKASTGISRPGASGASGRAEPKDLDEAFAQTAEIMTKSAA